MAPETTDTSASKNDVGLKVESILSEEFTYAVATASQAKEGRVNMFNLYLLIVGALVTGLGVITNASAANPQARVAFDVLELAALAIGGILSFGFFLRHYSLRQEYFDGMFAANFIKEFYIQHLKKELSEIEDAFHWRFTNIEQTHNLGGTFVISWTIALLGNLSFAGAAAQAMTLWFDSAKPDIVYLTFLVSSILPVASIIFLIGLLGDYLAYRFVNGRSDQELREIGQELEKRFHIKTLNK